MSKELLKHLTHGTRRSLTVSAGAVALDRGSTAQALTEAAELCLFAAKRAGRNRVIAETDEELIDALTGKVA
jgi:diguanylate cyclase